jgi:hypothetical protein
MNPQDQFWTEEFHRYSAECRRLARLARKPRIAPESRVALSYRHWIDWLRDVPAQYINPSARRRQVVAGG